MLKVKSHLLQKALYQIKKVKREVSSPKIKRKSTKGQLSFLLLPTKLIRMNLNILQ